MKTLPPLPPRCREHPNYGRGCPTCITYHRVRISRRARLQAYGQWNPPRSVDATEAVAHIQRLRATGMSLAAISRRSGVPHANLRRVLSSGVGRPDTIAWILATTPEVIRVDATGTARRLQALAACGYTLPEIRLLGGQTCEGILGRWRHHLEPTIPLADHERIRQVYDRLYAGHDRPSSEAMRVARCHGWLPPEAWTDATIDDPDAAPYSDPEAASHIDWVAVEKAKLPKGHSDRIPFVELRRPEQALLFEQHRAAYPGVQESTMVRRFKDIYRPVPIALLRELGVGR